MHEGVSFKIRQNDSYEYLDNLFQLWPFVYAKIVLSKADKCLPQLLVQKFDTLPSQCRHAEHMHEGVWLNNFLTK